MKLIVKLALLAVIFQIGFTQNALSACDSNNDGNNDGVWVYQLQADSTSQDAGSCVTDFDAQECYNHFGELSFDAATVSNTDQSNIISWCEVNSSAQLEVNVAFWRWNPSPDNQCYLQYRLLNGATPANGEFDNWSYSVFASADYSYTENNGSTFDFGNGDVSIPTGSSNASLDQYQVVYDVDEIVNETGPWENVSDENDDGTFTYGASFGLSVYAGGDEQLQYVFQVTLDIDRGTSATKNLTVTKTLVEGQCCENSLGVVSNLRFCPEDDAYCNSDNELTEIARNTQFNVVHALDLTDAETNAIASNFFLYPDEVKVGPFFPTWSIDAAYRDVADWSESEIAIQIQSNVAFAASVSVASRIWSNDEDVRPHTCFYDGTSYDNTDGTCSVVGVRRLLQQSGAMENQMSAKKGINIVDDETGNQNNNNNNNTSSDDDDNNTVLIAVVVVLVAVVAIAGIIGGVYYCKSRNQKQENNYNNNVKNIQQEQQA